MRRNRWLPRTPAANATGRVFLVPFSGCGASLYRQWPRRVDGVEFLPVELPGHETRFAEPTFETYQELASTMADGLEAHLDVPFAFFGHCGSALASYEVCRELTRRGTPPARLFVSSEVAPQHGPVGRYLEMDDAALGAELAELIGELGGTVTDELLALHLGVLRADVEANKRYVMPQVTRLSCPITAIGWTADSEVAHTTMGGWTECGDTTFVLLKGGHHRFTEAPAELIDLLRDGLEQR
ncbi:thioesterase II family protein [Micromonospora chokoriensis]|uniref:thioesterase II family protein n=1 Tax=Micromonospora chokoriensis TaxID=356851 RepID=UPI0004C4477B|nr:thioesterase domain-containing protein [Micromonospora chokoriensis]